MTKRYLMKIKVNNLVNQYKNKTSLLYKQFSINFYKASIPYFVRNKGKHKVNCIQYFFPQMFTKYQS